MVVWLVRDALFACASATGNAGIVTGRVVVIIFHLVAVTVTVTVTSVVTVAVAFGKR